MTTNDWSKTTRYFVLSLSLVAIIWFLYAAQGLVGPLVISALLAYVLNPIVNFVTQRTKMPRKWIVPVVYLSSLGALIGLTFAIVPIIPEQVQAILDELVEAQRQIEGWFSTPISIMGFTITTSQFFPSFDQPPTEFVSPDLILGVLQAASTNLAWILVIFVTTYYLLQDWAILRDWLIGCAPTEYQADVTRLYEDIKIVWDRYLRGQLWLMFIIGVLSGLGLAALGVPGAAALGILTGILDAILSVGPAVAMIIAAAVAWVAGSSYLALDSFWVMVLVLSIFGIIQIAENVWLRPRIIGHTLRLHPAVVFIAVMGALALAGVLVALIIIPVVGSVIIIGRYLYYRIFGLDPWPEDHPDNPVYEPAPPMDEQATLRNVPLRNVRLRKKTKPSSPSAS